MKKKVVIIDNFDSFFFNLVRYLREMNAEVIVMRNNEVDYAIIDQADALLISPGPGIPSEAGELMQVLKKYANHKKILGVCLGHQALIEHLGGNLQKQDNPIHGKSSFLRLTATSKLFKSIDYPIEVGRYHSWSVSPKIPKDVVVTSVAEDGTIMSFEHQNLPLFGFQFHPESILTPKGRMMIQNWLNIA